MTEQPANTVWSDRLTALASTVTQSWDHAASFTHSPNIVAHERAGTAMQMWLTLLGLDASDTDRGLELARKVVAGEAVSL